ncbi:MAG: SMI1/KNR4 family protein, partial [Helicobacteraceae bacterium]|nr:SMI1/KNR4 family protein [Helicobacteraceae bacterium]
MNKERLKHIWQTPIYLPYIHNDLTDEMVKNAEQKIGHKLPEEYLNLLKAQNGGYIRYELEDKEHSKIYGIGDHYPSVTINQLEEDTEAEPSFEIKGLTPFDDGEHTYLCFDYRKNGAEPTIAYIDVECDEEETIANNFKEYLSLLTPATRHKFVIQTEIGIEKTIKELGDILQIKFEEKADDYFLYGYPMYYAQYSQKYNIFIHPN